jgi:hypothetical protein
VSDKLTEMWTAFEAHEPDASYADEWATMCRERTQEAAEAAWYAAPKRSAVRVAAWAAAEAAEAAVVAAALPKAEAWGAAWADRYAQKAIDAIKEVKP